MDLKKTYEKGNDYFARCDYENALKYYRNLLEYDSENETLLIRISQCYQELDLFDEAIDVLSKLLDYNLKAGNLNKAIAVCKRMLTIDPDDMEIMLKLANIMRHAGFFADAVKYYRSVAKSYEYAGFLDKAIEILQTIQEIEKNSVEDLLDLVKKESAKGLREKASRNIHAIVYELKKGREYKLMEDSLNLALNISPDNISYSLDLARLCFHSGRLSQCVGLSLWALYLNRECAEAFLLLIKSLLALGYNEKARTLAGAIASGEIVLDDKDGKIKGRKLFDLIGSLDIVSKDFLDELIPDKIADTSVDLAYLDVSQYTDVNHRIIQKKVLDEENHEKIKAAAQEKTVVVNVKKQGTFSTETVEKIKEAEILIAEGLYEKAYAILKILVEENPDNSYIHGLMNKVAKHVVVKKDVEDFTDKEEKYESTDNLIRELENELDQDSIYVNYSDTETESDNDRFRGNFELFKARLNTVVGNNDFSTNFDLGIAYMELELWEESAESFNKVAGILRNTDKSNLKFYEAQIYYAVSKSNLGKNKEAIDLLRDVVSESSDKEIKISALYHLGLCFEKEQDWDDAKASYRTILSYVPDYRDIDVRLKLIGG